MSFDELFKIPKYTQSKLEEAEIKTFYSFCKQSKGDFFFIFEKPFSREKFLCDNVISFLTFTDVKIFKSFSHKKKNNFIKAINKRSPSFFNEKIDGIKFFNEINQKRDKILWNLGPKAIQEIDNKNLDAFLDIAMTPLISEEESQNFHDFENFIKNRGNDGIQ